MMLGETLLQKLARWRPEASPAAFEVEEAGVRVTLQADLAEALACRLLEVRVTRPAQAGESLAERADRLASRITGLLEPLRLLEVDGPTAQLRSDSPVARDDARLYYEVTLSPEGARVQRFQGSATGARRQAVPFTLTHEALAKLVTDLAS